MERPEIQELIEGMLNNEQTSEVLHRMSVSPERLAEFQEHLALRDAMARDARGEGLNEEEDDNLWAAVLGATGGLVTGGAAGSAGLWTWLGRAGAFLATGLAGFFIGNAVSGNDENADQEIATTESVVEAAPQSSAIEHRDLAAGTFVEASSEQTTTLSASPLRVDTVYQTRTIVKEVQVPQIVYLDRSDRDLASTVQATSTINPNLSTREDLAVESQDRTSHELEQNDLVSNAIPPVDFSYIQNGAASDQENNVHPFLPHDAMAYQPLAVTTKLNDQRAPESRSDIAQTETMNTDLPENLDDLLDTDKLNERSPDASKEEDDELVTVPTLSLLEDGFEIGYAERIGRVAPAPIVLGESDPSFDARSLDLTWRSLGGRAGLGVRLSYGTFSEVGYSPTINYDLGLSDTIYVQSLENSNELNLHVLANYRIPLLGSEQLALGVEGSAGFSSTRFTVGGDLSVIYLINDWLGAQAGAGYGYYSYTTQKARELLIELHENAGIASGLPVDLQGTMFEGRYGLFFRL